MCQISRQVKKIAVCFISTSGLTVLNVDRPKVADCRHVQTRLQPTRTTEPQTHLAPTHPSDTSPPAQQLH
jgi:hypothetical protein